MNKNIKILDELINEIEEDNLKSKFISIKKLIKKELEDSDEDSYEDLEEDFNNFLQQNEDDFDISDLDVRFVTSKWKNQLIKNFKTNKITNQIFNLRSLKIHDCNNIELTIRDLNSKEYTSASFDYYTKPDTPIKLNFNGMADPLTVTYMPKKSQISISIPANFSLRQVVLTSWQDFNVKEAQENINGGNDA